MVIITKNRDAIIEMKILRRYLKERNLTLNVEKSKIMVFEESKEKKGTRRWKWKSEDIEEVKEFQYLGYIFKKDTSYKG